MARRAPGETRFFIGQAAPGVGPLCALRGGLFASLYAPPGSGRRPLRERWGQVHITRLRSPWAAVAAFGPLSPLIHQLLLVESVLSTEIRYPILHRDVRRRRNLVLARSESAGR